VLLRRYVEVNSRPSTGRLSRGVEEVRASSRRR